MNTHTPEPWAYENGYIIQQDGGEYGYQIAHVKHPYSDFPDDEIEANAARIVACVNACAGMGDPEATINGMRYELDRFRTGISDAENREILELKADRDELLLALFDALKSTYYYSDETQRTIDKFEAEYDQIIKLKANETPPQP